MKLVIIGSGNLATHLSAELKGSGHTLLQVYSRTLSHARELAGVFGCEAFDDVSSVSKDADAYIISVKDDAVGEVVKSLADSREGAVFMHTAGSVDISVLTQSVRHAAVLYPMQSFTKGRQPDFSEIPVFIEASDAQAMACVSELASSISGSVHELSSEARRRMHLAAVFASNLTNHCYRLAERIADAEGLDFRLFAPLIMETARKATAMSPRDAQTGPMVRNDVGVMQRQMELIGDSLTRDIYEAMAKSIYKDSLDKYQERKEKK